MATVSFQVFVRIDPDSSLRGRKGQDCGIVLDEVQVAVEGLRKHLLTSFLL